MRKVLLGVAVLVAVVGLVGCAGLARTPVSPGIGFIFSDYKAPLDISHDNVKITDVKGEATTENILGIVVVGDSSVQAAAASAKIKTVHLVDYKFWNILGLYSKFTTIVYGEQ